MIDLKYIILIMLSAFCYLLPIQAEAESEPGMEAPVAAANDPSNHGGNGILVYSPGPPLPVSSAKVVAAGNPEVTSSSAGISSAGGPSEAMPDPAGQ